MFDFFSALKSFFYGVAVSFVCYANANGLSFPLKYHPQYGIYTATITVGKTNPQLIEVIIDTGSSSLVLMGNKLFCPQCKKPITQGSISPDLLSSAPIAQNLLLSYGSAQDQVSKYITPIHLSDRETGSIEQEIFIIEKSNQPASILGLIHRDLRVNQVKFIPFLSKITDDFRRYQSISFILCGEKGSSSLVLGQKQLPTPLFSSPLFDSHFYVIETTGFYSAGKKPIAITTKNPASAVLDTGTGGFVLLNEKIHAPLVKYLYQNAGKKNQSLGDKFWKNNYCAENKNIHLNALPIISIGFKSTEGDIKYLLLPPNVYVNQAGCEPGYKRLVFMRGLHPDHHATAVRNYHIRKHSGLNAEIVIGTSILNQYPIHIKYNNPSEVLFFRHDDLCK